MLYISRLVFSEDLMRVFYSLFYELKITSLTQYIFARAKQLRVGLFFCFFTINSPLPCTPLQKRPMPGWVVNINDILCTVLLSWFLLSYCSVLQSISPQYYSHRTVKHNR